MAKSTLQIRVLCAIAYCVANSAVNVSAAVTTSAQQEQTSAERQRVREQLQELRRAIAKGEANRSEAADALADSERAISEANRQLRGLSQQQAQVQGRLSAIGQQQQITQQTIAFQQQQLGQLLHQQYLMGAQDPYKLLFSGDNPNRIQRELHYMSYFARAQTEILEQLQHNLDQLQTLTQEARQRDAELTNIAQQQQVQRATLLKEQQIRRATLAKIADQLRAQRQQASVLERDEKRLSRVVDELAKAAAHKTPQKPLARAQTNKAKKQGSTTSDKRSEQTSAPQNDLLPEAHNAFNGDFAKLRGKLRLPVRGSLAARFGSARPDGGPSWKGLFIRAAASSEVKAIAPGRIIFAEWLRGFGNLLIVDHGDQYLSIYGNNESLFKQVGDSVQSGDSIAAVGNSGGHAETGLYFELRHHGRPFDPLSWATLK